MEMYKSSEDVAEEQVAMGKGQEGNLYPRQIDCYCRCRLGASGSLLFAWIMSSESLRRALPEARWIAVRSKGN